MSIIPRPNKYIKLEGTFHLTDKTVIVIPENNLELLKITEYFRTEMYSKIGLQIKITSSVKVNNNVIKFELAETGLGKEGYQLNITPEEITISAEAVNGLFYGMQTVYQLLPMNTSRIEQIQIKCCKIIDKPRFNWRGMHLDVSRHFFDVNFIKKYIDYLAMYKYNIFHWHLTDDNGWRIEIKKYPKLTEVGAWRAAREGIDWRERKPQQPDEKAEYGGFYTQKEIKEIVDYASERRITIIPEIEMPGHTLEVLAAYPELGCTGGPYHVATGSYWPNTDIFCAGNYDVFTFLQNVFDEVLELFPSKIIHIGGDEANKQQWKTCPKCLKRMREEDLKNVDELQSWFIKKIEKYLLEKGRSIIGWDEILEGGLAPQAAVMSWRGEDGGIAAAEMGHDVVMCPGTHCYFDHYQGDSDTEPKAIGGYTDLEKVYSYEPIPDKLSFPNKEHILGAQGNVWTEWMETQEQVEYMIFPRMIALAEVLWSSKENRNWQDFKERVQNSLYKLEMKGINFRPIN